MLLATCVLLTAYSALYIVYFHRTLATRIHHSSYFGILPLPTSATIKSIPKPVYTESYYVVYERSTRPVPRRLLPSLDLAELFTQLVRRNMSIFARLPQLWMMWINTPFELRNSLRTSHIHSLDFEEGDVVCGLYRAVARTPNSVEFEFMDPTPAAGRLVISFRELEGSVLFASETILWRAKNDRMILCLEQPALKFLHEMTAWWLLDTGVQYLMDLDVGQMD